MHAPWSYADASTRTCSRLRANSDPPRAGRPMPPMRGAPLPRCQESIVKTRKIERTRLVPHTVDGETEMVLDREIVEVPAPPADWDQRVRIAITIGACVLVTASLTWTTAS